MASVNAMRVSLQRPSEAGSVPVLARLGAADERVALHQDGLSAAEAAVVGRDLRPVPATGERALVAAQSGLELQEPVAAVTVEAEARRIQRGLRVEALVEQARDELHVALWLHVAAHQAERAEQLTVAQQHARDDRVERPPAGREPVRVARLEGEAGAPVLQD